MNSFTRPIDALLPGLEAGSTIYLIGAGGCGMSALGHLLLDRGFQIAGSDLVLSQEFQQLRERGATLQLGHAEAGLGACRPNLVIYSSAIRPDNPELLEARRLQIPTVRRGVALAGLARLQTGICVAGMHGKTTTTAMLAYALEQLRLQPSYAIGALVPQLSRHGRFSTHSSDNPRPLFVFEGDESDGTLREYDPEHLILLNLDEDHLDYFGTIEAAGQEFRELVRRTRQKVIYCADDPSLTKWLADDARTVSFGFHSKADYRVQERADAGVGTSVYASGFEVWHREEKLGVFELSLMGEKNISNAAAIVALLHQLGFAPSDINQAMRGFRGAARRQQELFHNEQLRIFDDYGHHPTEISATLRALRRLNPKRFLVAFQPHRYTRTQLLLDDFSGCFRDADRLWLTEIYSASEPPISGISGETLAEAVRARGQEVEYVRDLEKLAAAVRAETQPGDLVLFLGAGDITKAAHEMAALERLSNSTTKAALFDELKLRLPAATILRCDEPLAKRTTLRVGGHADFYVEPATETELAEVLQFRAKHHLPLLILGRGSNLLVRDGGVRGLVVQLAHPHFARLEVRGDELFCGAGVRLKAVAMEAKRHGLGGLEFLEGIPGTVGGGLRMNAGAMGSSMFEVVRSVRFMDFDGRTHERDAGEVPVEYRHCALFHSHVALSVVLKGSPASPEVIAERMNACSRKRWDSQPAAPSAGCIFKNSKGGSAGRLIDELGLKGTRVGGAVVSDVHGNFIVNEDHATARDVLRLIEIVQQRVRELRGIELETEVEIVGEDLPEAWSVPPTSRPCLSHV